MMDRKDIFMSGFKSKIGYSFTYKDFAEFEAIIDFYEQQAKKQKEIIEIIFSETKETRNIINNNRGDNILTKGCLIHYLGIVEDLLEEVSE